MDITLTCKQCAMEFIFSEAEQKFYSEKGFAMGPGRCQACRMSGAALQLPEKPKKEMYPAICAACGCQTELPFRPTGEKPVYCFACHLKRKKKEE